MKVIINKVAGSAVTVRGNDIDTDRIIPARFLKSVVFEGLGANAFEDDRIQMKEQGEEHPFDQERFAGSSLLFVNKNFGCGSSREHAPQSLMRWGVKAIIGESYSEIFYGNNVSIGVPCLIADEVTIQTLMDANEANPSAEFVIDLETLTVSNGDVTVTVSMPEGPREQFLKGSWDVTAELLSSGDDIDKCAESLPYFHHWK